MFHVRVVRDMRNKLRACLRRTRGLLLRPCLGVPFDPPVSRLWLHWRPCFLSRRSPGRSLVGGLVGVPIWVPVVFRLLCLDIAFLFFSLLLVSLMSSNMFYATHGVKA